MSKFNIEEAKENFERITEHMNKLKLLASEIIKTAENLDLATNKEKITLFKVILLTLVNFLKPRMTPDIDVQGNNKDNKTVIKNYKIKIANLISAYKRVSDQLISIRHSFKELAPAIPSSLNRNELWDIKGKNSSFNNEINGWKMLKDNSPLNHLEHNLETILETVASNFSPSITLEIGLEISKEVAHAIETNKLKSINYKDKFQNLLYQDTEYHIEKNNQISEILKLKTSSNMQDNLLLQPKTPRI